MMFGKVVARWDRGVVVLEREVNMIEVQGAALLLVIW